MEISLRFLYATLAVLFACHAIRVLLQRRINARQLPPRFFTLDPFYNFDWTFKTSLDGRNFLRYQEKYGKTYRLSTVSNPLGGIVTCDPDNVQAITWGPDWGVGWRYTGMKVMLGRGFLTTDGDEWMRGRKMLKPAFNRNNINGFETLAKVTDQLVRRIEERSGAVDMAPLLFDAFIDTSMQFILGVDPEQEDDGRPLPVLAFNEAWNSALLAMGLRLLLEGSSWILPEAQYVKASAKLHSFVDFAIEKSKTKNNSGNLNEKKGKKTLADIVVPQARSKEDARYQLMQIALANQDTTATLLCNTIQLLAQNPDIWKQLRIELMRQGPELMTFDSLRDNKPLNNIFFESLRIRPVFPLLGRRALRDLTLPTGGGPKGDQPLHVPAGSTGLVNFWSMNLNPDVFGPDVHAFRPDRWNTIRPSPKEFGAFGMGGRSCLGKEKALADAGYLLSRLVQRFERLEGSDEWKPESRLSMRNAAGYKVTFHV